MKTFLVPVDYSEVADNAARYALQLAYEEKAKVVLYHAFHIPFPVSNEVYVPMYSMEELERTEKENLLAYKHKLCRDMKEDVLVDYAVAPGFLSESIEKYIRHHRVDLIVMGITGGSIFKEVLIGSNAVSLLQHCSKNVLIVPADATYKPVKKIGLATNFEYDEVAEEDMLKKVKHFSDLFHASVTAIYVDTAVDINSPEKNSKIQHFEKFFGEGRFNMKRIESEDVAVELEQYVNEKLMDWVVIVPRKRNILQKLFSSSITKKLAFHLHVPILALHEEMPV